jgi:hypothetical protein
MHLESLYGHVGNLTLHYSCIVDIFLSNNIGFWLAYWFCPTLGEDFDDSLHYVQRAWFLLHCISMYGRVLFASVG